MNSITRICLLTLFSLGTLPSTLQAQFRRVDPAQATYQQQAQTRQMIVERELQCLQNTTQQLHRSFAEHCRQRRVTVAHPEFELLGTLAALANDVEELVEDVSGRSQADLAHIYRVFHLVEYSAEDSQTVACQTGYGQAFGEYFHDIEEHIEALATQGFRNPRIKRPEMHGQYGRHSGQQRQIVLPPLPQQPGVMVTPGYPAVSPIAPAAPAAPAANDPRVKVDLGDLFGRLFNRGR